MLPAPLPTTKLVEEGSWLAALPPPLPAAERVSVPVAVFPHVRDVALSGVGTANGGVGLSDSYATNPFAMHASCFFPPSRVLVLLLRSV